MGQPGFVPKSRDLWLGRTLAAGDCVFSLQSRTIAAASSTEAYRPPHLERTVLYRALAHHFEHFLQVYAERFRHTHGYLSGCVEPAVHRYLD